MREDSQPHPDCANVRGFTSSLDRPFVQKEIGWARKYGKKIIIVFEK